jgi:hypothetical protein
MTYDEIVKDLRSVLRLIRDQRFSYNLTVNQVITWLDDDPIRLKPKFREEDYYHIMVTDAETGEVLFDENVKRSDYSREQLRFNLSQYTGLRF